MTLTRKLLLTAAAAGVLAAVPASAAHITTYRTDLTALNGSGVSGSVTAMHDTDAMTLSVRVNASGVAAGQPHAQHIHGRFDDGGNPLNSVTPPPSADTDGDGFVELAEGVPFYGPVILSLTPFPTAPDGTIDFSQTYDLTDNSIFNMGFTAEDLMPLFLREFVLHGAFVEPGVGAGTTGEVDGTGGYLAVLPIASGEFEQVPEPAALGLLGLGVVVLGATRRRKA